MAVPLIVKVQVFAGEADDLGFALDALWTRLDLGSALVTSDTARAKDVLVAVVELADKWGAQTVGEAAGKRLRSLGVRTWQRGAGGGTALPTGSARLHN